MPLLYIIRSKSDGSLYIGSTSDIESRMVDHNFRSTRKYTCKKRPWEIFFTKEFKTITEAKQEELRLKRCKNRRYFEWYISNTK